MPAAGRRDYAATFRNTSIPADEPLFIRRGQDLAAADAVRCWANIARRAGTPDATIELALQQADAMAAWPVKKPADATDDLDEEGRLQLEYALRRRSYDWVRRANGFTDGEALAFTEGKSEAAGRVSYLRGLLRTLTELLDAQDDGDLTADQLGRLETAMGQAREAVKTRAPAVHIPTIFGPFPGAAHG